MDTLENGIEYLLCKNPLIKTIDDAKLVINKGLEDYTDYEYIKETENDKKIKILLVIFLILCIIWRVYVLF